MVSKDDKRIANRKYRLESLGLTKEYMFEEYISKNRSLQALANEHDVTISFIRSTLKSYKIVKSKELIAKSVSLGLEKCTIRNKASIEQLRAAQLKGVDSRRTNRDRALAKEGITREVLYDLYIVQNKSLKQLMEHFDLKKSNVRKLLNRFDIPSKTQSQRDKIRSENIEKLYADEEKVQEIVERTQTTIRELYGNGWYRVNSSKPELEILAFLEDNFPNVEIINGRYGVIKNPATKGALQLDIWIPEFNFAIEFNGEYWHDREEFEKDLKNNTFNSREALKSKLCDDKNIKLIHIWDGDWKTNKTTVLSKVLKDFSNHVTKFQKVEMDHSSIASSDVALDS